MPSRKKNRGKQRKSRRSQVEVEAAGRCSASPEMISGLKAAGCRIERGEGGGITLLHPSPNFNPNADPSKLTDRSLLDEKCRRSIADNYVRSYARELREGGYNGTRIIGKNLLDIDLGPQLSEALAGEDIHTTMLHFLGQCGSHLHAVLSRNDCNPETPSMWMTILELIVQHGGCSDETQLALASGIEQLVMCMIDAKRELFRSKKIWHTSLPSFFTLVHNTMMLSSECLWIIAAYEGLIPFVAQASCWGQCRQDIVAESRMLQITDCLSIENACHRAQSLIYFVVARGGEALPNPLELIASTPLLSDDANCADSTIVGMIRMMNSGETDYNRLSTAIKTLLFSDYVDSRVIAELIEYVRGLSSLETVCFTLSLIRGILGLGNDVDNKHIRRSDSRFAAAVHHGLVELCFRALVPSGNHSTWTIVCDIVKGLYSMALHKKTSLALRRKKPDILLEMDTICKKPVFQFDHIICPIITDSLELGAPTCCNCLKEFYRKDLRFCECCNIECYCSRDCQLQSWNAGHNLICRNIANSTEQLRRESSRRTDIKRFEFLKNKLMMSGCRFVNHNIEKIVGLKVEESVVIDFQRHPPSIKLVRSKTGTFLLPSSFKCTFVSSYASQVGTDMICVDKAIPISTIGLKTSSYLAGFVTLNLEN